MKRLRLIVLSLLMVAYGMPVSAVTEVTPDTFILPNAVAGETYNANIASTLQSTYHLRLESDARAAVFRWAMAGGEIPPGLMVRPNGAIVGVPRVARTEPYLFQVRVLDISLPRSEPLKLNCTILVSSPRVRLAHISMPRLVGDGADEAAGISASSQLTLKSITTENKPSQPEGEINQPEVARPVTRTNLSSNEVYASMLREKSEAKKASVPDDQPTCDSDHAPLPSGTGTTFSIDARDGNTSRDRQFERKEKVSVIIDNQNPYLYTYKFTSEKKVIEETAPSTFFSFLGGVVGDYAAGTAGDAAGKAKAQDLASGQIPTGPYRFLDTQAIRAVRIGAQNCGAYENTYKALISDVDAALDHSRTIAAGLKQLSADNKQRSDKYDTFIKTLHNGRATSGELYCASKSLTEVPDKGAAPAAIETAQDAITQLNTSAEAFKIRIDALQEAYPDCADMVVLNLVRHAADGLIGDAAKYDKGLKKIAADLKTMNDLEESVAATLRDPRKFRTIVELGNYPRTTEVSLGLTRTAIQPVDGKDAKAEELVKPDDTTLKFGHAPFFSISGGVVFSPLDKFEFDRIQGFERDRQGNLVLVDGKPNLTTVVGRKEGSSSRITPMILLNGRVHDKVGPIDGIHVSLGITAKNDNKGTDIEYLVGPSLSFLEDNLYFTFGGYAGRQQKLGGGLFEGFAVPATVSELPIEKNYRWNFGFALSYRIPVNKK